MKPAAIATCLWLALASVRAEGGMEFGMSMPYAATAVPGRPILSLSWFTGKLTPIPGYAEYGFVAMLPMGDAAQVSAGQSRITDFAGMYAGHLFIPFHGLVRPGFNLGWLWEGKSGSTGGTSARKGLSLYYALKVQASCLSFIASNKGIGGGFNFSF